LTRWAWTLILCWRGCWWLLKLKGLNVSFWSVSDLCLVSRRFLGDRTFVLWGAIAFLLGWVLWGNLLKATLPLNQ
jgi:hypothetical protein